MKKIITIVIALMFTANIFAQAPEKMSYQAVVRDASNVLVTNQAVGMQISILQGSPTGVAAYIERHTTTSNVNGVVMLEIGTGTVVAGNFSTINWANGPYFIKTETDPTGGTVYSISGTTQLMSVPYALYSKTAENVTNDQVNDADANPTNEIQTISRTGTTVTLSNGGGTFTDSVNTYVAGTNITIVGNVISATNGHYVGEFYGGGVIFWVSADGQHGLIASLTDLDGGNGVAWSASPTIGIMTARSMKNGSTNTAAIVAQDGTAGYAATMCNSYSGGGYNDWYLPSGRELYLLASQDFIISGFGEDYTSPTFGKYWSSTEYFSTSAWYYSFPNGSLNNDVKTGTYRVRAIRSF